MPDAPSADNNPAGKQHDASAGIFRPGGQALSMNAIAQSNARLWNAILCIRIFGRDPATMCEVRDALNSRRRARSIQLTPDERRNLEIAFYRREAPDMLHKLHLL